MTPADKAPNDAVGVIIPPPEVRTILETTATYVGWKPALEGKVRQLHENDPSFMFLHENDPYHAYFRKRVAEVSADIAKKAALKQQTNVANAPSNQNAESVAKRTPIANAVRSTEEDAAAPASQPEAAVRTKPTEKIVDDAGSGDNAGKARIQGEGASAAGDIDDGDNIMASESVDADGTSGPSGASTTKGAAVISFLKSERAKAEAARPEPTEPPPEDVFTLPDMNPLPSVLALDVMKLTAEYAARFGESFVSSIAQRESRNPLFDFLKPMHAHFVAYQRLVDAYKLILDDGDAKKRLVEQLRKQAESPDELMREVWYLHDWDCQRAEREHEARLDEKEKIRRAQIDWHDFVVLATVDFDPTEFESLPTAVADAKQLPKMLAAARKAQVEMEKNRGDIDMDIDEGTPPLEQPTAAPAELPRPSVTEAGSQLKPSRQPPAVPKVSPAASLAQNRPDWSEDPARRPEMTSTPAGPRHMPLGAANASLPTGGQPVTLHRRVDAAARQSESSTGVRVPVHSVVAKDGRVELGNVDGDIPANLIRREEKNELNAPDTSGLSGKGSESRDRFTGNQNEATVVLPSGQRVPLSKAEASVRAELLDPSYKKERARAEEKNRKQNLAGGEEVARNLERLQQVGHYGGIYNRSDLQDAVSGRRKAPEPADGRLRKAAKAGPLQPGQEAVHDVEEMGPPAKKAKVAAAFHALMQAKTSEEETAQEAEVLEEVEKSAAGGSAVETPVGLVAADEWLKKQGENAKVRIQVAKHANKEWKLQGQEMELSAPLKKKVLKLKSALSKYIVLPANKQKLQVDKIGFLKDDMTLAYYNIGDGTVISVEVKERGGRKKH